MQQNHETINVGGATCLCEPCSKIIRCRRWWVSNYKIIHPSPTPKSKSKSKTKQTNKNLSKSVTQRKKQAFQVKDIVSFPRIITWFLNSFLIKFSLRIYVFVLIKIKRKKKKEKENWKILSQKTTSIFCQKAYLSCRE